MKKLYKKIISKSHKSGSSHIGLGGLIFSERITGKYNVLRTKGTFISLIFARLNKKRISCKSPLPHNNASINNFFEFNLSFYFELIGQLTELSSSRDRLRLMSTMTNNIIHKNPYPSVPYVLRSSYVFTPRSLWTLLPSMKRDVSEMIIPRSMFGYSREILSNLKKEEHQLFQKNRNLLLSLSYTLPHNISLNFAGTIHPSIEMIRSIPAEENFNLGEANFYRDPNIGLFSLSNNTNITLGSRNIHRVISMSLHEEKHLAASNNNLHTNFSFSFQNSLPTILISAHPDAGQKIAKARYFPDFQPIKLILSLPADEKFNGTIHPAILESLHGEKNSLEPPGKSLYPVVNRAPFSFSFQISTIHPLKEMICSLPADEISNKGGANFPLVPNIGLFSFSYASLLTLGSKNIHRAISKSLQIHKHALEPSDKGLYIIVNRTPSSQIIKNPGDEIIYKNGKTNTNFSYSFHNSLPAILVSAHSGAVQKIAQARYFLNFSPIKMISSLPADEKSNIGGANNPPVPNNGIFSFLYASDINLGSKNIHRTISKSLQVQNHSLEPPGKSLHPLVNKTPSLQVIKNTGHEIIYKNGKTNTNFSISFQNALPAILVSAHFGAVQKIAEAKYFLNIRETNIPLHRPVEAMKNTLYENNSKRGTGISNFTNQKNDLNFNKAFHPLISDIPPSNAKKEEAFGAENIFDKFQARRNNNYSLIYKKLDQDNIFPQSTELILKKVKPQQVEDLETNEQSMADNALPTKNQKNLIKESFKETSIDEISIAEKVYEIIERKISIERDRRGLF